MSRYLRIPIGERGTASDNRAALVRLLVFSPERADELPDDAAVPYSVNELSYPHIVHDPDTDRLLVRVEAQGPKGDEMLTVYATENQFDALALLRDIERLIADDTIELYEPGAFGALQAARVQYDALYLPGQSSPDQAEESTEVAANA